MSATKTQSQPATMADLLQPRPTAIDFDAYQAERARRQAEHEAKRPELIRCLDHRYASKKESEKPVYRWAVSAQWLTDNPDSDGLATRKESHSVVAKDEAEAWAKWCDEMGTWPSRREVRPIIERGKKVSVSEALAESDAVEMFPEVTLGPLKKRR